MKISSYKSQLNENGLINLVSEKDYNIDGRRIYNTPEAIADFVGDQIGLRKAAEEFVYIICFDSANHITGCFEASHGSMNASMFPVREICKKALLLNAASIAVTHNHPSGVTEPSQEDIAVTKRLKDALQVLGLQLLDHVIVAGNTKEYYSFCKNGII